MEFFDVIEKDGTPAGYSLSRNEVHSNGVWHRTVHIWILNSQGELLLQKRSPKKEVYPGLWDISCAGHVSTGEDSYQGAIRELKEELGLSVQTSELKYLFTITQSYISQDKTFIDNELTDVFLLRRDFDLSDLKIDITELVEVKFIPAKDLLKIVQIENSTFAPHDQEYKKLHFIINQ